MSAMTRRRFITISAAAGLSAGLSPGFAKPSSHAPVSHWTGTAMGAATRLSIAGLEPGESDRLITLARGEIERLEAIFSLYQADSTIMQLNKTGRIIAPPLDFVDLLHTVDRLHRHTNGAFNPTIQPLWRLLAGSSGAPSAQDLKKARNLIDWRAVRFSSREVAFTRPGMALTLNGIAQGYATDKVARLLKDAGLQNLLVSVGEIAAFGRDTDGKFWKAGIADKENMTPDERVILRNQAIATSAPLGTVLDRGGQIGHILAPHRADWKPQWRRISVLHSSATVADGLSTALTIMSEDEISETLRNYPGIRVIGISVSGQRFDQLAS